MKTKSSSSVHFLDKISSMKDKKISFNKNHLLPERSAQSTTLILSLQQKSRNLSSPIQTALKEQNLMFVCSPQWSWSGIKYFKETFKAFLFYSEKIKKIVRIQKRLTQKLSNDFLEHPFKLFQVDHLIFTHNGYQVTRPISIRRVPIIERVARYDIWRGGSQNPA